MDKRPLLQEREEFFVSYPNFLALSIRLKAKECYRGVLDVTVFEVEASSTALYILNQVVQKAVQIRPALVLLRSSGVRFLGGRRWSPLADAVRRHSQGVTLPLT